jgi:glycosyltransferase involved in cell wall biosynthesis
LLPETKVPEAVARLPRPVIGYLGGVDPWKIDVGLLRHMAHSHPGWSIALCRLCLVRLRRRRLRGLPQCPLCWVPQAYGEFPAFLKGMDVCIMPFPLNETTLRGDALKLYEYLSGGRPVVSTPVPSGEETRVGDTHRRQQGGFRHGQWKPL